MKDRIYNEPVALLAVVEAFVYAVTEFGVALTDGQQAAVLALVAAVLTLVTRNKVTPTRKL